MDWILLISRAYEYARGRPKTEQNAICLHSAYTEFRGPILLKLLPKPSSGHRSSRGLHIVPNPKSAKAVVTDSNSVGCAIFSKGNI